MRFYQKKKKKKKKKEKSVLFLLQTGIQTGKMCRRSGNIKKSLMKRYFQCLKISGFLFGVVKFYLFSILFTPSLLIGEYLRIFNARQLPFERLHI